MIQAPETDSGGGILLVDDNPDNLKLLAAILNEQGYHVRASDSGRYALKSIRTLRPDLILLDVKMPEMDGIEALHAIRELTTKVPIIALTANVMVSDVDNYLQQGFVAHVGKPVDMNSLYGVLTRYVK